MSSGLLKDDRMMFVGKMPWHHSPNATELPRLATAAEAIIAANLPWVVYKEQVYAQNGKALKDYFLTIREDTGEPLGCVGNLYTPLQNVDAFKFFDEVTLDPNGPKYETAGSLWGGKQIWILARLPNFIQITDKDVIQEYLILVNRHDGRGAIQMYWVSIRVVCANTLTFAMNSKGAGIKFRHIGEVHDKVGAAREALCIAQENHNELINLVQHMVDYEPTEKEINDVISKLLPNNGEKLEPSTQTKNARLKVRELVAVGAGNNEPGIEGTAWALYNGLTEYADHVKVIRPREGQNLADARLDSILWGSSADFKNKALEEVTKLVTS